MIDKTSRYWHWWVISFFLLTLLCCLVSCFLGGLTTSTDGVRKSVLEDKPTSLEAAFTGAWFDLSLCWWVLGMCGVTFLTLLIVVLTLVLGKSG